MIRTVVPAASLLLLVACSSSSAHSVAAKPASPAATASTAAHPKPTKACPPSRDLLVRYKVPGDPTSAQMLGSVTVATCGSTLTYLRQTSPQGAGYCTWAAWSSDNPGYNPDLSPAKPLRKVLLEVGAGC